MTAPVATHLDPLPGHRITVTVGDLGATVGRAWMDCQCGITATRATRWAAEQAGLIHHADVAEAMGDRAAAQTARDLIGRAR